MREKRYPAGFYHVYSFIVGTRGFTGWFISYSDEILNPVQDKRARTG